VCADDNQVRVKVCRQLSDFSAWRLASHVRDHVTKWPTPQASLCLLKGRKLIGDEMLEALQRALEGLCGRSLQLRKRIRVGEHRRLNVENVNLALPTISSQLKGLTQSHATDLGMINPYNDDERLAGRRHDCLGHSRTASARSLMQRPCQMPLCHPRAWRG
jgi:hypothetical protein